MAAVRLVPILLLGCGLGWPAVVLSQTHAGSGQAAPAPAGTPVAHKPAATPKTAAAKTAATAPSAKPAAKAAAGPTTKPVATSAAKPAHPPAAAAEPAKPEPPAKEAPKTGPVTGLPIPRFASLRSDDVNLRVGPGTRYPISWVYKRRELPVQIEREYEIWRLVSDPDGNLGWVHQANLIGRRTFILRGETRTMRRAAEDAAAPVAVLKPGVVGRLLNCAADSAWCEVQVGDYRGYLRRDYFWGTFPGEAVN
jgi:SH3-like domain-containing protein